MPLILPNHVIKVTVFGQVLNQETVNTWFYGSDTNTDGVLSMITAFGTTVLAPLLDIMNSKASFIETLGEEVFGGDTFDIFVNAAPGNVSGDCLPPYVSWDFTLLRDAVGHRNGYKRIAGVSESQQVDGSPTNTARSLADTAATAMTAHINPGADDWFPVIQRKTVNGGREIPPKYQPIANCQFSKIGSQNSRKVGHGR